MRVRWRSQPAGGGLGGDSDLGAGGAAAVDPGQLAEPVAFQPLQQPPQDQDALGGLAVGEGVQVLGGQFVDHRGQGRQVRRPLTECVFGSMAATYPTQHPTQPPNPDLWIASADGGG
jgi:hypothetical protein